MKPSPYANNGRKRFDAEPPVLVDHPALDRPCKLASRLNSLGRPTRANENARRVWTDAYGPPPPGYDVGHVCHDLDDTCAGGNTCKHRACYELTHLALQTRSENIRKRRLTQEQRSAGARGFKKYWDAMSDEEKDAWRQTGRENARKRYE